MTANEYANRIVAVLREAQAEGFEITGHWDESNLCGIFPPGWRDRTEAAWVTTYDLEDDEQVSPVTAPFTSEPEKPKATPADALRGCVTLLLLFTVICLAGLVCLKAVLIAWGWATS